MFTQDEQYTKLPEFTIVPHLDQQNESNVIPEDSSMEHTGGTVEQHPDTVEEIHALFESLYNNLVIEVEKYVYQEQCLTKKINAPHLSSAKTITTLNEEIENLNTQLSKEISNVSYLEHEREKLKSDLKTREDELLDKLIQCEKKIKELDNILVKTEADESLDKITGLEKENECLLRAVVSWDIMSIVQNPFVVDTSNLQTDLERMKEKFETCIIKKENKYAIIWNDWYKKCEECKYDKISYNKAYDEMQHQIERLQAQLRDLKEKMKGTSVNTKFSKPSILGKPPLQSFRNQSVVKQPTAFQSERPKFPNIRFIPKVIEIIDLTKPVTSHSVPKTQELKVVKNKKVIAPGMFRINPFKNSREYKAMLRPEGHSLGAIQRMIGSLLHLRVVASRIKKLKKNQKKHKPKVKKSKKTSFKERLASPRSRKPRSCLRWSPTGRIFDLSGKIINSSDSECKSDTSVYDDASASNLQKPTRKWFPNSTSFLGRCSRGPLVLQTVARGGAWVDEGNAITHHMSFLLASVTAFHLDSSRSSSDSLPVHSSGLHAPDQDHSGSSARDVPPRLCYPPRRAPRRSEAFLRWCAAPLSTLSPVDYVPSSTPVIGSLAPTRADLLLPQTEVDIELGIGDVDDVRDHVEIDPRDVRDDIEEYEADTSVGDTVEVGIDPMSALIVEEEIVEPIGEDSSNSSGTRDGIVRSFEDMPIDLNDVVRDFYHHMSEVRIDRIVGIETVQRRLEVDQLIARGQRVSMIERIDSLRLENLKVRAMLDIERDHVNSLRLHMSLSQEEFRQVRRDRDETRGRLRRLESYVERRLGFRP
ncbi:hypothetical protein Tco_0542177 [Tanacetum coccineum]